MSRDEGGIPPERQRAILNYCFAQRFLSGTPGYWKGRDGHQQTSGSRVGTDLSRTGVNCEPELIGGRRGHTPYHVYLALRLIPRAICQHALPQGFKHALLYSRQDYACPTCTGQSTECQKGGKAEVTWALPLLMNHNISNNHSRQHIQSTR